MGLGFLSRHQPGLERSSGQMKPSPRRKPPLERWRPAAGPPSDAQAARTLTGKCHSFDPVTRARARSYVIVGPRNWGAAAG
jgi:hypothetical protein